MPVKKSSSRNASPRTSSGSSTGKKPFRRRGSKNKGVRPADPDAQRLNKILAAAGLGSRRDVEDLIVQGRVEIDREIVTDLSFRVDPRTVTIKVDGSVLKKEQLIYYALNKPTGVLSTNRDPDGRMRVIDLVPDKHRVFSVGRLDRSSEGLILLTNDGELAQRLAHPKFAVQKSYFVVVSGVMTQEELDRLRKGVHLAEGFARIDGATIRRQRKGCTELEIVLSEGKNREIRRILARAGHKVVVLRRIAIGPLRLGQLPVGASRILLPAEVRALYAATEHKPKRKKAAPTKPGAARGGKPTSVASDDDETLLSKPRRDAEYIKPMFEDEDEDDDGELFPMSLDDDGEFGEPEDGFNDDDFVGHFSSTTSGAVLDYDEEKKPAPSAPRRAAKSTKRAPRGAQRAGEAKNERSVAGGTSKHEANRAAGPGRIAPNSVKRGAVKSGGKPGGKPGGHAGTSRGAGKKGSSTNKPRGSSARGSSTRAKGPKGSKGR